MNQSVGLVLGSNRNQAIILFREEEQILSIPGKWRRESGGIRPLVPGDRVSLTEKSGIFTINTRLDRGNEFTRKLPGKKPIPQTSAVNIDRIVIVVSVVEPATPLGFIDRMLVAAAIGGVPPVLVLNKIDLDVNSRSLELIDNYRMAVETILPTCARDGMGVGKISTMIEGKITLIAGSSGVGKSTLINSIDPHLDLKTGLVSGVTGKGKHITSFSRLHRVRDSGWVIDTPGLRECAPWGMTESNLQIAFPEVVRLAGYCHFRNCLHHGEDGCAVEAAAGTADLPAARYASYLKLLREVMPPGYWDIS